MKKNFNLYVVSWAILLAIYNVIVFCVKAMPGYEFCYDARFWIAWAFVIASFLGQLVCAMKAFKAENKGKLFLNLPLITGSYTALIMSGVISSAIMLIPDCPTWISAVVCISAFGFNAIALMKAVAAADMVGAIDDKIKVQTFFIKMLTADADSLMARAKDEEAKAQTKKVYEAIRYSDPMSNDALSGVEQQISAKFAELSAAVDEGNSQLIAECAEKLLQLVTDRNNKCKVLK